MRLRHIALAAVLILAGIALYFTEHRKVEAPVGPQAVTDLIASSERELSRLPVRFTRSTDEQEIHIGEQLARGLPSSNAPVVERYIQEVGAKVAKNARRKLPYRFHFYDERSFVNAFALPGGNIVIGRGMLELMDSEDELAAVLGHEIEHVDLYHCADRVQVEAAIRKVPLAGVFALPVYLFQAGYSKDQELEADREGLDLAVKAGYSPAGALRFNEKMMRLYQRYQLKQKKSANPLDEIAETGVGVLIDYFRTHPLPAERLAQVRKQIEGNHWDANRPETDLRIGWFFWSARAQDLLKARRYDLAVNMAERALKTEPRQPDALQVVAESRMALAQFDQAAAAWRAILEVNPQNERAMRQFADALGASAINGMKQPREAEQEFRAWASSHKDVLEQARVEEAGLAAMAGNLEPSSETIWRNWDPSWTLRLAEWHYRAGQLAFAMHLFEFVHPPRSRVPASNLLGWILLETGTTDRARAAFEANTEGGIGDAIIDWRDLELEDALNRYARLSAEEPLWANTKWIAGFYSPLVVDTITQMQRARNNVARKDPKSAGLPEVVTMVGQAREAFGRGEFVPVIMQAEVALRLDPHSGPAWYIHGLAAARLNRIPRAEKDFENSIRWDPKRRDAYTALDVLWQRNGQFARLVNLWSGYIQLVPQDGEGWLARSKNYARQGNLPAALKDAEEACKRGSNDGCKDRDQYRANIAR